jgi:hypothetical protein
VVRYLFVLVGYILAFYFRMYVEPKKSVFWLILICIPGFLCKWHKKDHVLWFNWLIKNYAKTMPIACILYAGDQIDGDVNLGAFDITSPKLFAGGSKVSQEKTEKQAREFKETYVLPFDKKYGKEFVYLGPGNQDFYAVDDSLLKYIQERHGALYYAFDKGAVHFICCGVFPDQKMHFFLRAELGTKKW